MRMKGLHPDDRRHHQAPGQGFGPGVRYSRFPQGDRPAVAAPRYRQGIGSPKSTVYELVASLLERRILEPVGQDGHVYLGRQLYFLGQAHLRHFDLTREADSALQEIVSQTRETAQMCLLNGRKYTVALMKEGERHFRISSNIGENAPIPWTASGRLLLGHLSDEQIVELIDERDFILPTVSACLWRLS